jgi:hypothetical protein
MRDLFLGFLLGLSVGGGVWAAGPMTTPAPSGQGTRPDRQWEQDRGAGLREYMQQRAQDRSVERERRELTDEIERLNRRPC